MNRKYFDENVTMAVEVEFEDGYRKWEVMPGKDVPSFINGLKNMGLSDVDFCSTQADPEIREVLDRAWELFRQDARKYGKLDSAIDAALAETEAGESKSSKNKKVWTEDEIRNLVQTNDKVLYGALKKLYAEQTADEQRQKGTTHRNGAGFNSTDAGIMSSFAEFLNRAGFLTYKQKAIARKKLVKYTKQLTRLANA